MWENIGRARQNERCGQKLAILIGSTQVKHTKTGLYFSKVEGSVGIGSTQKQQHSFTMTRWWYVQGKMDEEKIFY